eukprot:6904626-Prymnesium_polylepis.1
MAMTWALFISVRALFLCALAAPARLPEARRPPVRSGVQVGRRATLLDADQLANAPSVPHVLELLRVESRDQRGAGW